MTPKYTIRCSKCGSLKGTRLDRLESLIKKHGSKEKLEEHYTCRSCKKNNPNKKKKLYKSKIECSQCHEKKGTVPARLKKLIGQFGSLEELQSKYVCRHCRKVNNMDRRGKLKPTKRKRKPKKRWGNKLPLSLRNWTRQNRTNVPTEHVFGPTHVEGIRAKNKKEKDKFFKVVREALEKHLIKC